MHPKRCRRVSTFIAGEKPVKPGATHVETPSYWPASRRRPFSRLSRAPRNLASKRNTITAWPAPSSARACGALLGNAVSGHGGKPGGTIIGGVGGAVVGNQIAGIGHATAARTNTATTTAAAAGCPRTSTAYGYYGPDGRWVANAPAGYAPNGYNQNGYSQNGYPQDGYDRGYAPPPAPAYGRDAAYSDRGGRMNFREREDRMDQYIRQAISSGTIDDREGRHDLRELNDIRRMEADYRSADGHMNDGQRADIDQRLDALRDRLHMQNDQRSY